MCDSSDTFPGEFHLLGLRQLPRLPRLVSFSNTSSAPLPLHLLKLSTVQTLPLFSLTVLTVRLCLVGAADTPGCVSLLPASLFSNSNPGWCEQHLIRLLIQPCYNVLKTDCCFFAGLVSVFVSPFIVFFFPSFLPALPSDQPGMLCSFKISSAWSCAWCLNPQFDKTFSTGMSSLHHHLQPL